MKMLIAILNADDASAVIQNRQHGCRAFPVRNIVPVRNLSPGRFHYIIIKIHDRSLMLQYAVNSFHPFHFNLPLTEKAGPRRGPA